MSDDYLQFKLFNANGSTSISRVRSDIDPLTLGDIEPTSWLETNDVVFRDGRVYSTPVFYNAFTGDVVDDSHSNRFAAVSRRYAQPTMIIGGMDNDTYLVNVTNNSTYSVPVFKLSASSSYAEDLDECFMILGAQTWDGSSTQNFDWSNVENVELEAPSSTEVRARVYNGNTSSWESWSSNATVSSTTGLAEITMASSRGVLYVTTPIYPGRTLSLSTSKSYVWDLVTNDANWNINTPVSIEEFENNIVGPVFYVAIEGVGFFHLIFEQAPVNSGNAMFENTMFGFGFSSDQVRTVSSYNRQLMQINQDKVFYGNSLSHEYNFYPLSYNTADSIFLYEGSPVGTGYIHDSAQLGDFHFVYGVNGIWRFVTNPQTFKMTINRMRIGPTLVYRNSLIRGPQAHYGVAYDYIWKWNGQSFEHRFGDPIKNDFFSRNSHNLNQVYGVYNERANELIWITSNALSENGDNDDFIAYHYNIDEDKWFKRSVPDSSIALPYFSFNEGTTNVNVTLNSSSEDPILSRYHMAWPHVGGLAVEGDNVEITSGSVVIEPDMYLITPDYSFGDPSSVKEINLFYIDVNTIENVTVEYSVREYSTDSVSWVQASTVWNKSSTPQGFVTGINDAGKIWRFKIKLNTGTDSVYNRIEFRRWGVFFKTTFSNYL